MFEAMIDPTGGRSDAAGGVHLAPRPDGLRGLTVGLLANPKRNAEQFLDAVGAVLEAEHGTAGVVRRKKMSITEQVPADVLAELVDTCDVVVVGVGDCGSCSASAVADGLAFEDAGLPAVVICTEAFTVSADAMAGLRGSSGYRYARTPHPVAALDADGVSGRAGDILPDLVEILTASPDRAVAA